MAVGISNAFVQMFDAEVKQAYQANRALAGLVRERSKYHGLFPGELENSIQVNNTGRNSSEVFSDSAVATYVENGTRPHWIYNNPIWAKIHREEGRPHPGARPMHFMRDAFIRSLKK